MRTVVVLASVVVAVLGFAACDSGTSSSGGASGGAGVASQTLQTYCDARETRSNQCVPDGSTPTTFSRTRCTSEYNCALAAYANPDAYLTCRTNPDCAASNSDDKCLSQSAGGRVVALSDVCAKKYASCKSQGSKTFDDDTCPLLNAIGDAVNAKLAPCFDKACAEIGDCLESSLKAAANDCDF
jgi:hypothetical protein